MLENFFNNSQKLQQGFKQLVKNNAEANIANMRAIGGDLT